MNGQIAQIVALTCFGNAFLAGHKVTQFFPANSTCRFCDRVNFISHTGAFAGNVKINEIAGTPDEWFEQLKSIRARGIFLSLKPDNRPSILGWFSGVQGNTVETWRMAVIHPDNRNDCWSAHWEVWNQKARDKRIWRVSYRSDRSAAAPTYTIHDAESTSRALTGSLTKIHAFAQKHDCGAFTGRFANALETLNSKGKKLHGYHKDLAPPGLLTAQALGILDACQSAWVFGGMGSWNDLSFWGDAQKEYVRLSKHLLKEVSRSLAAVANSTLIR